MPMHRGEVDDPMPKPAGGTIEKKPAVGKVRLYFDDDEDFFLFH